MLAGFLTDISPESGIGEPSTITDLIRCIHFEQYSMFTYFPSCYPVVLQSLATTSLKHVNPNSKKNRSHRKITPLYFPVCHKLLNDNKEQNILRPSLVVVRDDIQLNRDDCNQHKIEK